MESQLGDQVRLGDFILQNLEAIISAWFDFALANWRSQRISICEGWMQIATPAGRRSRGGLAGEQAGDGMHFASC